MNALLAALGEAALAGSNIIGRNRELQRQEERDALDRQQRLLQMALMKEDQSLQKEAISREKAKEIIDLAGPNGILDDIAAKTVGEGGMGFRLTPQDQTISSQQFGVGATGQPELTPSVGMQAGMRVVPTTQQQVALDDATQARRIAKLQESNLTSQMADRDRQQQYRDLVNSDAFFAQPEQKRQAIWTLAGMPGDAPQTFEDRKKLLDYTHGQRMEEIHTMYPADRFGGASRGRNSEEQLYFSNVDKVTDNIRANFYPLLQAAAQNGDQQQINSLMSQMQRATETAVSALPKPKSMPAGPVRLSDNIDDFLGKQSERDLQTIIKNLPNPQFRAEFGQEQGVDMDKVYGRLQERGFYAPKPVPNNLVNTPAPAPQGVSPAAPQVNAPAAPQLTPEQAQQLLQMLQGGMNQRTPGITGPVQPVPANQIGAFTRRGGGTSY